MKIDFLLKCLLLYLPAIVWLDFTNLGNFKMQLELLIHIRLPYLVG